MAKSGTITRTNDGAILEESRGLVDAILLPPPVEPKSTLGAVTQTALRNILSKTIAIVALTARTVTLVEGSTDGVAAVATYVDALSGTVYLDLISADTSVSSPVWDVRKGGTATTLLAALGAAPTVSGVGSNIVNDINASFGPNTPSFSHSAMVAAAENLVENATNGGQDVLLIIDEFSGTAKLYYAASPDYAAGDATISAVMIGQYHVDADSASSSGGFFDL